MATYSRTRTSYQLYRPEARWQKAFSGAWQGTTGAYWSRLGSSSEVKDNLTPGYYRIVREGLQLPVNDFYSLQRRKGSEESNATHTVKYTNPNSPYNETTRSFYGNLAHAAYYSAYGVHPDARAWGGTDPSMPNSAVVLQQALANANSASFDALTFSAELGKTMGMVRKVGSSSLRRTRDILHHMDRYRTPSRTLRVFSEMWLEYRYGWRTLMYDIEAMNDSINVLDGSLSRPERYTAYAANEAVGLSQSGTHTITKYAPSTTTISTDTSTRASWVFHQLKRSSVRAGVGISLTGRGAFFADPLVTGYELIPWSFVADWFFTLGTAIKAHSPFANTKVLWAFVTTKKEYETTLTANIAPHPNWGGYNYAILSGGSCDSSFFETETTRVPSSPSLALAFNIKFDYQKAADLAALGSLFLLGRSGSNLNQSRAFSAFKSAVENFRFRK